MPEEITPPIRCKVNAMDGTTRPDTGVSWIEYQKGDTNGIAERGRYSSHPLHAMAVTTRTDTRGGGLDRIPEGVPAGVNGPDTHGWQ